MARINKHHLEAMSVCLKYPVSKMGLEKIGKKNLGLLHDAANRSKCELVHFLYGHPIITKLGKQKVKQYLRSKK